MWDKRSDTIVHERSPFNAEPSRSALAEAAISGFDAFYSRYHGPVPDIPAEAWRLTVSGLVDEQLNLSLD